jgi:hypothetical protein
VVEATVNHPSFARWRSADLGFQHLFRYCSRCDGGAEVVIHLRGHGHTVVQEHKLLSELFGIGGA